MTGLNARRAALALSGIALITLPIWVGNPYYINVASQILLFAVFALALNVLVGYGGLVSLGHAGLFAMAGYTGALALQAGHGHFIADLAAVLVTVVASAVFGILALRSTGIFSPILPPSWSRSRPPRYSASWRCVRRGSDS